MIDPVAIGVLVVGTGVSAFGVARLWADWRLDRRRRRVVDARQAQSERWAKEVRDIASLQAPHCTCGDDRHVHACTCMDPRCRREHPWRDA